MTTLLAALCCLATAQAEWTLDQAVRNLKDPEWRVRHEAVNAMLRFKPRDGLTIVIPLLRDPDAQVRTATVYVAVTLGGLAVADVLLPMVKDPDSQVRRIAAYHLGALGVRKAIPALLELLDGNDTDSDSARFALANLKTDESVAALLARVRGIDEKRQDRAISALVGMKAKEVVPDLLKILQGAAEPARHARWALEVLEAKEAVPDLVRLSEHQTPVIRIRALEVLGNLGTKDQVAPPTRLRLLDGDAEVRRADVAMLRRLRSTESADAISALLGDSSESVRGEVVQTLGVLDARSCASRVLPSLKDPEANVRAQAARTLARLALREAVAPIAALLKDPEPVVREAAVESLGRLAAVEHADAVAKALEDPEDRVRAAALRWCCVLGSTRAVPQILEQATGLWVLNALARRDAWARWARPGLAEKGFNLMGPEALRALSEAAGDRIVEAPEVHSGWHSGRLWEDQAGWLTLGEELNLLVAPNGYEAVLSAEGLRLLPREKALEAWRAWWKSR